MGLESEAGITGVQDLIDTWPEPSDPKREGDDHLRVIKKAVTESFPNMTAPWTTTDKATVGGLDATGNRIENVGGPVDRADAVAYSFTARHFGIVNDSGLGTGGTTGWASQRLSTGHYRLTFSTAADDRTNQVLQVQIVAGATLVGWAQVDYVSSTVIDVYTMTAGGPVSLGWSFIRRYLLP